MQSRQLEYFVAVAEELSFTRAARRLFVSQSALSQQLRTLERELGCRLIERDNHHVTLTPAGRSFLEDSQAILARTRQAVERARRSEEGISGSLAIGYIKGYERTNLADMLYSFHESHPKVQLSFLRKNVAELYDALRREDIDVAINLFYSSEHMEDIQWQGLRSWPLKAVVPLSHPLAHRAMIELSELRGYPLVDIDKGKGGYGERDTISQTLREAGLDPQVSLSSEDVETSVLCVAAGLGFALLPGYLTDTLPAEGKVVALPLAGMERKMPVVAAWLPSHKNELLDVFLDTFLDVDEQGPSLPEGRA